MKSLFLKLNILIFTFLLSNNIDNKNIGNTTRIQDFQGKAYYVSKSSLNLGNWGATMSQEQKKQVQARLKNRLEKTFILTFNREESMFKEDEKLDAISGATDSWGKNFAAGDQYKNVATNIQIQDQEFYGKQFLVKDELQPMTWNMGSETKKIGNYTCFKATTSIPASDLAWYSFSWGSLRNNNENDPASSETSKEKEIEMTEVVAWYTPQIPVKHGPSEYWGLPGLILEVNAGNTSIQCSKLVLNPDEKTEIKAPKRGKEITKKDYKTTIIKKMKEFRDNRGGRRRG